MTEHINIPCIQTMWSFGQNLKKVLISVEYTPTKNSETTITNYPVPMFPDFLNNPMHTMHAERFF